MPLFSLKYALLAAMYKGKCRTATGFAVED